MQGGTEQLKKYKISPLRKYEEYYFINHMVSCPKILQYLSDHEEKFDLIFLFPYMFSLAALGPRVLPNKSYLIPCLHDERYIFMDLYKKSISSCRGLLSHVKSERNLACNVYGLSEEKNFLLGEQVNTNVKLVSAEKFRDKYELRSPYILYLGRKIEGKNLPQLVSYFINYKRAFPGPLKLVLLGEGNLSYKNYPDILDLGFLKDAEKNSALAGALTLVQPSLMESFSIVMMEAWLQKTPNLVNSLCDVTRDHCLQSGGGFIYSSQESFDKAINQLLRMSQEARVFLAENGLKYVKKIIRLILFLISSTILLRNKK